MGSLGGRTFRAARLHRLLDRRRLVTVEPGLYGASSEKVFGRRARVDVGSLRLSRAGEEVAFATRSSIVEAFAQGAFLVSYVGHGGIHLWADENVFDVSRVDSLAPQSSWPLLLTMDCLNGYFDFPYLDSLSEALLKVKDKGAIAAFSPSGLSLDAPAQLYQKVFLRELLASRGRLLGDVVAAAQAAYLETGAFSELLTIYHLLGDPALKVPAPSPFEVVR